VRRALVTGGARGLGRAIAERLASEGVEVVTPARAELDLASRDSVHDWLERESARGTLAFDILVNNAGENFPRPLDEVEDDVLRRTFEVNFFSAFALTAAILPAMRARGGGRVVNVSSIYAQRTRPGRAVYGATKAALESLTRTAAVEAAPHGVLVNAVAPGFVETELTRQNNGPEALAALSARIPVGRLAAPPEIAEIVAFLASERNTYLTGHTLVVDGGFSLT
jgi:3-oxoacyl-[acyl-carrier protein] reductase